MKQVIKTLFHALPLKPQLFHLLRGVWSPPERLYRHLYFKGIIRVKAGAGASFRMHHHGLQLENEIFWGGLEEGWEKVSMNLWRKLVLDADTILDVGANTGLYALVAQTLNPQAQVYAFEPVADVYNKLNDNIRLNDYPIRTYQLALSDFDGEASVWLRADEDFTYSVTVNENHFEPTTPVREIRIPTRRLDTWLQQEGPQELERLDLMKVDVETHEVEVLRGMGELLARHRPTFLIEILDNKVAAGVEELVQDLGYLYYNLDEKTGGLRYTDKLSQSDYFNYLLCQKETAQRLGLPLGRTTGVAS